MCTTASIGFVTLHSFEQHFNVWRSSATRRNLSRSCLVAHLWTMPCPMKTVWARSIHLWPGLTDLSAINCGILFSQCRVSSTSSDFCTVWDILGSNTSQASARPIPKPGLHYNTSVTHIGPLAFCMPWTDWQVQRGPDRPALIFRGTVVSSPTIWSPVQPGMPSVSITLTIHLRLWALGSQQETTISAVSHRCFNELTFWREGVILWSPLRS